MSQRSYLFINVMGYQLSWWLLVCLNNNIYALLCAALSVVTYLACERARFASGLILIGTVLIGSGVDSLLAVSGVYGPVWQAQGIPIWLVALWFSFATLLNISLKWLQERLVLAAFLGSIGGASSYWAGSQLGAIDTLNAGDIGVLMIVWLILTPLLLYFCKLMTCVWPLSRDE
ncbi:DUF2878 domain-containing protein [Celerinatantimonas yamalensis]|uniref:DUF2878 domain-containing protein n=1 Tax=Celerinatantimonas yamalensis TaxID=559956 RepID=A0ABW9GA90_9GAMM